MKFADIKSLLDLCGKSKLSYLKLSLHDEHLEFRKYEGPPDEAGGDLSLAAQADINGDDIVIKADFLGRITLKDELLESDGGIYIEKDEQLCEIEAMKMQHPVLSPVSGELIKICVKNGDMVEFGTDLFVIKVE